VQSRLAALLAGLVGLGVAVVAAASWLSYLSDYPSEDVVGLALVFAVPTALLLFLSTAVLALALFSQRQPWAWSDAMLLRQSGVPALLGSSAVTVLAGLSGLALQQPEKNWPMVAAMGVLAIVAWGVSVLHWGRFRGAKVPAAGTTGTET
jgi:hypothetical protein